MTRRFAIIGVAALALTGSAALSAQPARPGNAQERPRMEQMQRGPGQGMGQGQRMGPGQRMGQGLRRGPGGPGRPGGPGMALRGLNLTDEQKAQVKAIHEKTKADIESVLTPEQREMLKNRRGGRGGRGGGGF